MVKHTSFSTDLNYHPVWACMINVIKILISVSNSIIYFIVTKLSMYGFDKIIFIQIKNNALITEKQLKFDHDCDLIFFFKSQHVGNILINTLTPNVHIET